MQIDWFTLIAQIVNFLILLVLLKKVLFDRIVKAMDERQEKISSQIEHAENKEKEAQETLESYESKKENLEQERHEILSKAKKEAQEQKEKWAHEARQHVDEQRQQWEKALQQQRDEFIQKLKRQSGAQVYEVARKVLTDMADFSLEQQIVNVFLQKLQALDEDEKEDIRDALSENGEPITILTSFELEENFREYLKKTIHDEFQDSAQVNFDLESDMICGVDLRVADQKITWSIDDYLQSLEQMFDDLMEEQLRSKGGSEQEREDKTESESEESEESEKSEKAADSQEESESNEKE